MSASAPVAHPNLSAGLWQGWQALRDGRLSDAEELFSQLWADHPHSCDAVQGLAWALLCGEREEEGERLMNLIANAELPHFLKILADLEEEVQSGARIPRSVGEALLLSHHAQYQNNAEEALRLARRAREMAPGKHLVETNYACCLALDKRYDEALSLLHAMVSTSTRPTVWHNIGFIERKRGNREAARKAWRSALITLPDYALSHQALWWEALCRFRLVTACRHWAAADRARKAARFAEQAKPR